MLAAVMSLLLNGALTALDPAPVQPCNIELTGGKLFDGAPFLPAAIAIKAAEKHDARVNHRDAKIWEWNYHVIKQKLLPLEREASKRFVMHVTCQALDANDRHAWLNESGDNAVTHATLMCIIRRIHKNGERKLTVVLNADLQILAAKQLWRADESVGLCSLPRKPPTKDDAQDLSDPFFEPAPDPLEPAL